MKKLPIGIQTFEEIVEDGYLYVDKTKIIYDLVTGGKTYFISRPRSFGKSLLCSTLEEILKGNKELFKGLWIYDSDYQWEPNPVISISMQKTKHNSHEEFEKWLAWKVESIGEENGINVENIPTIPAKVSCLLKELSKKNKVAIIIDEYDKPILDHIVDIEVANKIRETLRGFYSTFKDLDRYISFILLTGVSKFSKTSIFSGLNNLKDLTFDERISSLFGYTQKELELYFEDRIKKLASKYKTSKTQALHLLKAWYNGYRFSKKKETVYNPFSILLSLDAFDFNNYWFETGTPTFLIKLIKEQDYRIKDLEYVEVGPSDLSSFEIEDLYPLTVFYQTGYLTIVDFIERSGNYRLSFPNKEVKDSFLQLLIKISTKYREAAIRNYSASLRDALDDNDMDAFIKTIKIFYAEIPYTVQDKQKEQHYQLWFYALLKLLGFTIVVEEPTNIGRIDAVIEMKKYIYVFEFKVGKSAVEAIKQIKDKKYFEKYARHNKKLVATGINFSMKEKNISDWICKEII